MAILLLLIVTEILLYNFDLVVGDVILGGEYVGEPDLLVVEIDSRPS